MKLKYDLRAWQTEAMEGWLAHGRRGIVEVVTGGGKTTFAEACILRCLETTPGMRVMVIVPTVALLDQWVVSLQDELDIKKEEIAAFGGGYRSKEPALINVLVANTARRWAPKLSAEGSWFLIVDECHRLGSERNREALEGSYEASLGLSATPDRQYDNALQEQLIPRLGCVVYRYDLVAARRDGVVSPFTLVNVEVNLLPDEEKEYKRLSKRIGMLNTRAMDDEASGTGLEDSKLEALLRARARVANRATMRIPVACKLVSLHKNRRTMVFHEDIRSAEKIVQLLKETGHSVTNYHTKVGPSVRTSNLLLYRKGAFEVMVSCRALDEGINIPETEVAIVASSTATMRQRIQRLGRVLRPSERKDRAIIYTLYATDVEARRLQKECAVLSDVAETKWMKGNVRY